MQETLSTLTANGVLFDNRNKTPRHPTSQGGTVRHTTQCGYNAPGRVVAPEDGDTIGRTHECVPQKQKREQ